jgi:hypothetical protein
VADPASDRRSVRGYFNLAAAAAHDISRQLLQHYVRTGDLRRLGRGAFQFAGFAAARYEDGAAAWLWSDGEGVLSHETALMLHGLIDERPARVHLTLPSHWYRRRVRGPRGVVLHYLDLVEHQRQGRPPMPFTALDASLIDSAEQASEPALVEAAFTRVLESGMRDRGGLRLCLPLYHPLRQRLLGL